tara:strand:+ start:59 stop:538 length:480 start_codon:yes stop_codon:yes gene_type:complete
MSKKLIGKARQRVRKKSATNKTNPKELFTVNAGKTISSEVEVIKLHVKRSEEDTEKCDVTYQPYFFIENWTERFGNAMEEPLASPIYELMQTLKKKEHLDEVRGLLFLGCGMTEKGIDLPIEIHGVDTMELCSGIDYCFFSVKKTMDNLRVLDEIKEAA